MKKIKQYKVQIGITIITIIFLLLHNANNNRLQQLKGEYTILESQFTAQKENVILLEQYRKKEKDSLLEDITARIS